MTLVGVAVGVAAAGGNGGGSTVARQGKDGLVHSSNRSAHHVGADHIWVLCWAPIPARCACVGVINVTTMSAAVVPILPTLVGSGRVRGLLCAGTVATKPGWLLWETPPPLPPPAPLLLWSTPLRLSHRLLNVCCCCAGATMLGGGCWLTAMQNYGMFVNWPCIAAMVVSWVFIDSCVAAYAAPKFTSNSLYDAIDASSSIAVMPYPCCEAGAAVWLTSASALAQYSLKESIVSLIGGDSFSREI